MKKLFRSKKEDEQVAEVSDVADVVTPVVEETPKQEVDLNALLDGLSDEEVMQYAGKLNQRASAIAEKQHREAIYAENAARSKKYADQQEQQDRGRRTNLFGDVGAYISTLDKAYGDTMSDDLKEVLAILMFKGFPNMVNPGGFPERHQLMHVFLDYRQAKKEITGK